MQRNAGKMDHLIDDLLEFSKMGRKEIRKLEINMEQLVYGVIEDINTSTAHKSHISINTLLPVYADRSLLTQVWINLISNAIKYSGKKETSQIEIGSAIQDNHEIIYYVKDNGAGFSMDYVDKLFCVFQRLHSNKEFEGTGIGLAIVQRIINRHGGKVWAEGKVNEGATFYFTLPISEHAPFALS
ncbi:MAG: GHKL domain-containing protein [Cytophagales bacterium]|nr:GHKL domain-containing protein [Cytophaga sp.]